MCYMKKDDQESRFVYALDKIELIVKLYLYGGRIWKEMNVTLDMAYKSKKDKVSISHKK
jgi:HD domain